MLKLFLVLVLFAVLILPIYRLVRRMLLHALDVVAAPQESSKSVRRRIDLAKDSLEHEKELLHERAEENRRELEEIDRMNGGQ